MYTCLQYIYILVQHPCRAGQQFAAVKDPHLHLVVKITRHVYRLVKLER